MKLVYIIFGFFFIACFSASQLFAQNNDPDSTFKDNKIRVVFYNVENLFDVFDDSLKNDDEFTAEGIRNWNNNKFYKKIKNVYKVLIAVGEWDPPAVVGLCEVENRFVLEKLIYETPLKKFDYRILHFDSPDRRGIDVALLYRGDYFKPIHSQNIEIIFPFNPASKTRDILYVKGILNKRDTIHFFINHWPSRYGGYLETIPKRKYVAQVLKEKIDSVFQKNMQANILIMGDFNDNPFDESITEILKAKKIELPVFDTSLVNLMTNADKKHKTGTIKYKGSWDIFDQIIVSGNLINGNSGITVENSGAVIFNASFLLTEEKNYPGYRPHRTYYGYKYTGGFSDHLPVYIDIFFHYYPAP